MHCSLIGAKTHVLHLACILVRSAEELFANETDRPRPRQQEDHRGAWSAAVDNEAVVAEAPLERRYAAAQHDKIRSALVPHHASSSHSFTHFLVGFLLFFDSSW